jgi:hypothetical protein
MKSCGPVVDSTSSKSVHSAPAGGRRHRCPHYRHYLAVVLLLFLTAPLAAQDTVQPDCCALLYSTGRWLGWSASLLESTRAREAPSPFDGIILQSLTLAGQNAAAANRSCLQELQAWPDWQQKQQWLAYHIAELQRPSDPIKTHTYRRQLAFSAIAGTYSHWGGELSRQRLDGNLLRQPTCATYYFQLGFDLAYTTQAYRQAGEAYNAGDQQAALHQLNETRLRLHKALNVLDGYGAVQRRVSFPLRCADIGLERLREMIRLLANTPPNFSNYAEELQYVNGISDQTGRSLLANCIIGAGGDGGQNIAGRWDVAFGGHPSPVGTAGENVIRNRGELVLTATNGGFQGTFRVFPLPWENLLDVSFVNGVLRFTRPPTYYSQFFQGVVRNNRVEGTFTHRGLTYRWWAERRD